MANLPIDIPPELLATGGTITIQKRKVSITKAVDGHNEAPVSSAHNTETHSTSSTTTSTHNTDQAVAVPIKRSNETHSSTTTTTNSTHNTDQSSVVPIKRTDESHLTTSNTSNQNQTTTSERRGSKVSFLFSFDK